MRLLFVILLIALSATAARAQDGAAMLRGPLQDMLEGLPDPSLQKLLDKPDRFLEEITLLIVGYGDGASIDEVGIENFIALRRAKVRARELRRFDLADLDGDGTITRAELGILITTERASARGRLLIGFRKADLNRDDVVSPEERRRYGQIHAMKEVPDSELERLKSLLSLDENNDGRFSLDELMLVLETMRTRV
ncbi:hypothetical protein [Aliiroseovarius sp. 2305UL8-7]|uniref:hypothetical protein n=1 Tax=Aliiroseovarius conchicola TaxID=3121637 RepID=UPI003527FA1C